MQITSPELNQEFQDKLKIQSVDGGLVNVSNSLVPVLPLTAISTICEASGSAASGTTTIYTVPTGRTFYLTACHLRFLKDATCDSSLVTLEQNNDGSYKRLLSFQSITLTADGGNSQLNLAQPLKLRSGTIIRVNGTFTVGALAKSAGVIGYLI